MAANLTTRACACKGGLDVCKLQGQCTPFCEQPAQVEYLRVQNVVGVHPLLY
jgi:hypothetical protein